jgi:hypothetical protein
MIHATPNPAIDVFVVHKEAIAALGAGHNPYAITFHNIYPDAGFYPAEVVADDRVLFGFPYPPLSLLLVTPAERLFADFRYANAGALTIAGGLMGYTTAGLTAKLAAAVYLYTPRAFFVLEQAWTEPIVVLLLAMTALVAVRFSRWMFVPLGGLLIAKQYMLLAAPAALLFAPQPFTPTQLAAFVGKTAGVALLVTAPFVFWDVAAFLRSVAMVQIREPVRFDSLGYVSLFASYVPPSVLIVLGPLLAVTVAGLALWRLPRSPGSAVSAIALVTFVLVAFGKKAFCNYYFFVIGGLACATAILPPRESAEPRDDLRVEGR